MCACKYSLNQFIYNFNQQHFLWTSDETFYYRKYKNCLKSWFLNTDLSKQMQNYKQQILQVDKTKLNTNNLFTSLHGIKTLCNKPQELSHSNMIILKHQTRFREHNKKNEGSSSFWVNHRLFIFTKDSYWLNQTLSKMSKCEVILIWNEISSKHHRILPINQSKRSMKTSNVTISLDQSQHTLVVLISNG